MILRIIFFLLLLERYVQSEHVLDISEGQVTQEVGRQPLDIHDAFTHRGRPWMESIDISLYQNESKYARFNYASQYPESKMYGGISSMGLYYAVVHVDGQPIRVHVDTGSSTLAVPLKKCRNCGRKPMTYDTRRMRRNSKFIKCSSPECDTNSCNVFRGGCPACSSGNRACCSATYKNDCGFYLSYADKSGAAGALIQADVSLAGMTENIKLGGILQTVGKFNSDNVDGIFGLADKEMACNPTCITPLFDKFLETGKVRKDIFSLCLSENGGTLTFGGSNPSEYEGELQYTPMKKKEKRNFYEVKIDRVLMNGNQVRIPKMRSAITDSGTTLFIVSTDTYIYLKRYFQTYHCDVPYLCSRQYMRTTYRKTFFQIKTEETMKSHGNYIRDNSWFNPGSCVLKRALPERYLERLPTISIVLENNVKLDMDPKTYMIVFKTQPRWWFQKPTEYYCLGIQPLPGIEQSGIDIIMGDVILEKYYHQVDRESNRIGFALTKKCGSGSSSSRNSFRIPKIEENGTSEASTPPHNMYLFAIVLLAIFGLYFYANYNSYSEYTSVE